MTVIAYTKGILAADTLAVDEDGLALKCTKLFRLKNGTVVGTAGDADARAILDILGKASVTKLPSKSNLAKTETDFRGLWAFNDKDIYRVSVEKNDSGWSAELMPMMGDYFAIGAGGPYALGAMLAGKSAVEACKIACRLDNTCGLPVEHIVLDKKIEQ